MTVSGNNEDTPRRRAKNWAQKNKDMVALSPTPVLDPLDTPYDMKPPAEGLWSNPALRDAHLFLRVNRRRLRSMNRDGLYRRLRRGRMIFVHIPKNAGSSVSAGLYGDSPGHYSMQMYERVLPNAYLRNFPTFAILRDPRERFASAFNYLKYKSTDPADRKFSEEVLSQFDTLSECIASLNDPKVFRKLFSWSHFCDQCQFIVNQEKLLSCDFVFSMSRIDLVEDFIESVTGRPIQVGHLNRSKDFEYNDLDWSIVEKIYAQDLALFQRAQIGGLYTSHQR